MKRVVLVTGAAGGLGRASAVATAKAGLSVAVADLSAEAAATVAAGLPGGGHAGFPVDVAAEADVEALFDAVEARMGPVAVLQNFAGVVLGPADGSRPSIVRTSVDEWDRAFAINARGAFLCIRAMLRRRAERPVTDGRIILVSSSAAQIGGYASPAPYIASKGAVLSLTKAAAREAAALGITVNCIAPGAIDTPMLRSVMPPTSDADYCANVPLGRIGEAEDIAATALFLSSPAAGYITGACIDVNGGIRMQ